LELRHREIVPRLRCIRRGGRFEVLGQGAVVVRWSLENSDAAELVMEVNLGAAPTGGFSREPGRLLWQEGVADAEGIFGPDTVRYSLAGGPAVGKGE
jgi:hypothetical protein